jgi:hypothetical protein
MKNVLPHALPNDTGRPQPESQPSHVSLHMSTLAHNKMAPISDV